MPAGTGPRPVLAFTKAWRAAWRAAGCPGRIPHDLRRTAIRHLVRARVPERVAVTMIILGIVSTSRKMSAEADQAHLTRRACTLFRLEAPPGIEPGMEVLQTVQPALSY